ncbi:DNA ligase D, partial [Aquibium sp. A9E412]|uniref:DNA ligase D n=1 Tax=Aquibium sp. A9E412 TaxID=2976767 RepID=UPI0025B23003
AAGAGLAFVVQKHDASRLHYDFRLEWDGVLKSWAVTRGPSLDPSEKRLAVRTEDHPLAYGGFEGTIPQKEYGGGTVMLWDRGTWEPETDPQEGLAEGKLTFTLHGERLSGKWSLVRMRRRKGESRENWLLVKNDDGAALRRGDVLNKHAKSVASGRTMRQIATSDVQWSGAAGDGAAGRQTPKTPKTSKAAGKAPAAPRRRRPGAKTAMPRWREPQLATLVDAAPEGEAWLSEMKYDGYRALIAVAGGRARVYTRNGKDWTDRFPAVAEAAAGLATDGTLIDGEIVAFGAGGRTDFSALQQALKTGGALTCFVFDLLEEDGEDLRDRPLVERKGRLEALIGEGSAPLVYSAHVLGGAAAVHEKVCAAGHEGIVAKRADAPYRSGRSRAWLKVKCSKRQELVIGGWSPSDKKGRAFSSILLGAYEGDRLVYRGRVGSGFDGDALDALADRFRSRARKTSPFADLPRAIARGARFVTPDLVAEIEFTEFTADGMVRHGVFKGLREDKAARAVTLERAEEETVAETQAQGEARDSFAGIRLSSPDKVLFAGQGVTKADLAAHYERVAERMMPLVENRLVSLVRCPQGRSKSCFFQRHGHKGFPEALKRMEIAEADGKRDSYLFAEDLAGLVAAVQMGTLEFHIWGSRIDRLERPDRLVFDLDPDESITFKDVRAAAFDLRARLAALGLETVALVTGGKGIHVVAPLERRAEWPQVKQFARDFAYGLAEEDSGRYVAKAAKAKRSGRIFLDRLRNERGATAIAPYSTRARPGAPVAMPVSWDELETLEAANTFGLAEAARRVGEADPWAEAAAWRQSVTKAMRDKVARA